MKPLAYLRALLSSFFRRQRLDADLDEELRTHIAQHADHLERSGVPPAEAQRRARLAFGSLEKAKETVREQRPSFFLETLFADLRFALRTLRKHPGFTAIVILTLALGIGANTAIFSVVDAVLLRPLPFAQPDRLVTIAESNHPFDLSSRNEVAPGNFLDWRTRNHVFSEIAGFHFAGYTLTGSDRPERVQIALTSAGMLHLLGLRPKLGRDFQPADDRDGAPRVAMLSADFWQERFASDPAIVGKTIYLDTNPYTVVGVLPPGVALPGRDVQFWIPLEQAISPAEMRWKDSHYLDVYARLKPNVTLAQASDEMNRVAAQLKQESPDTNSGAAALVIPLQADLSADIRPALLILLAAVAFVLLIACANVANLLLVRSTARGKEIAVRLALGAGKSRILRQLLTESLLLSLAGGAAGLLVANWTRQLLLALSPTTLPQLNIIETDGRVLLFTFLISVATGVLFGLSPAFRITGLSLSTTLHGASRSSTSGKSTQRLRNLLVVAEIAISLVLLVGAGLTIRSFLALHGVNLGFRSDHTLTVRITIPKDKYAKDEQVVSFYDTVLQHVRSTPGIEDAGLISYLPLTGDSFDNSFDVVGRPPRPPSDRAYAQVRIVDPQYFQVLGISLLSGRGITDHDRLGSARSVVISQSLAKRFFPATNPVGQRLLVYMGENQSPWEVVGIVTDVRSDIDASPEPTIYFPYAQIPYRYMVLAVRTHTDPHSILDTIRSTVSSIDPDEPVYQVQTLTELVDTSLVPWRFSMTLLSVFAAIALVLAAAGIYGVMAFLVVQRTHEVGVRMALGAQRRDVLQLIVGQGAKLAFAGLLAGVLASLWLTRLMSGLLFGVSVNDPFTFFAVALLLASVALAASFIPAQRATKIEPTVALRYE